jgi:hypothetical protein
MWLEHCVEPLGSPQVGEVGGPKRGYIDQRATAKARAVPRRRSKRRGARGPHDRAARDGEHTIATDLPVAPSNATLGVADAQGRSDERALLRRLHALEDLA